jgi:hypothetical protein
MLTPRKKSKFYAAEIFVLAKGKFRVELWRSLKPAEKFPPLSQSNVWEPGVNPGRLRHCNGYKLPMPLVPLAESGRRE